MTVDEFKKLRDLPNKVIVTDLVFVQSTNPDIFTSELKINALGLDVVLNATYQDSKPSVVFNFRVVGGNAICRYCVNNTEHKDANTQIKTRTHKHTPQNDSCFNGNKNLPFAYQRTDLQISDFADVEAIWETVCKEANINHLGKVKKL